MLKYIILLLSSNSKSFCYYPTKTNVYEKLLPLNLLKRITSYSKSANIYLNVIYGKNVPPQKYDEILSEIDHVKIVPLSLKKNYKEAIYMLEESDLSNLNTLNNNLSEILILRLSKKSIIRLYDIVLSLIGKFKRLNLCFTDIELFTAEDFEIYKTQLDKMVVLIAKNYTSGNAIEINLLSDRILLNEMNNCEAGQKHITFAPNGKFYICPGFYFENEKNNQVGDLKNGINIINEYLLYLKNAPICSTCDAFQCKRCFYLNNKLTNELNTPSKQQCVISHIERNCTRDMLVNYNSPFMDHKLLKSIPPIEYLDPFEIVRNKDLQIENKNTKEDAFIPVEVYDTNTRENFLQEIYKMQMEINDKLNYLMENHNNGKN